MPSSPARARVTRLDLVAGHHVAHPAPTARRWPGARVVAATGAHYRKLPVADLEPVRDGGRLLRRHRARSPSCAPGSRCVVVGGGNSAGQAAMFLAEQRHHGVHRRPATAGRDHVARTSSTGSTPTLGSRSTSGTTVTALAGEPDAPAGHAQPRATRPSTLDCTALFSFIGAEPNSAWLGDVATDEHGFVRTDRDLEPADLDDELAARSTAARCRYETSRPGLLAVGDLRSGSTKRVAAAVGEGSAAIRSVHQHLNQAAAPQRG